MVIPSSVPCGLPSQTGKDRLQRQNIRVARLQQQAKPSASLRVLPALTSQSLERGSQHLEVRWRNLWDLRKVCIVSEKASASQRIYRAHFLVLVSDRS